IRETLQRDWPVSQMRQEIAGHPDVIVDYLSLRKATTGIKDPIQVGDLNTPTSNVQLICSTSRLSRHGEYLRSSGRICVIRISDSRSSTKRHFVRRPARPLPAI